MGGYQWMRSPHIILEEPFGWFCVCVCVFVGLHVCLCDRACVAACLFGQVSVFEHVCV